MIAKSKSHEVISCTRRGGGSALHSNFVVGYGVYAHSFAHTKLAIKKIFVLTLLFLVAPRRFSREMIEQNTRCVMAAMRARMQCLIIGHGKRGAYIDPGGGGVCRHNHNHNTAAVG